MAERVMFASDDTGVVEDMFRQTFGRVDLDDSRFALATDIVVDDRYSFGRLRYTGRMSAYTEIDGFAVLTNSGNYRWEVGEDRGGDSSRAFLARPGVGAGVFLADTTVNSVSFDAGALERTARAMYGDDELRVTFDSAVPLGHAADRVVAGAIAYALTTGALALESDLIRSALYRHLAAVTLESFALQRDMDVRSGTAGALRDGYRRALAFIDDFASLPITLDDIAEAAGLSSRDLHAAFQSFARDGGSVRDHLRAARLDAAHQDLVAGDPSAGHTVREIALRWGFSPSRLAAVHREVYGVTPKQVLDR